jgi:hypothetical protein
VPATHLPGMGPLLIILLVLGAAIAYGVWRRFSAIQWIWLLFATSILMVVIWTVLVFFVIGPNMRRMMEFQN